VFKVPDAEAPATIKFSAPRVFGSGTPLRKYPPVVFIEPDPAAPAVGAPTVMRVLLKTTPPTVASLILVTPEIAPALVMPPLLLLMPVTVNPDVVKFAYSVVPT
jgi:hypothetical protein